MNAELVKRQDRWDLYGEDGSKIASSAENPFKRLSIKNCEAIANGYDLDELLDGLLINRGEHPSRVRNPLYGEERQLAKDLVQKALEILGDKKFSVEDIQKFLDDENPGQYPYIALQLKQRSNEWDVEIVLEDLPYTKELSESEGRGFEEHAPKVRKFKLDEQGCLILKRS